MRLPNSIDLFYVPAQIRVVAQTIDLTDSVIRLRMGDTWWNDPMFDMKLAEREIDRHWNWQEVEIERDGEILSSRKL